MKELNVFDRKTRKKAITYIIISEICFVAMFFLVG